MAARPATAVVGKNAACRVDGKSTAALVYVVVAAKAMRRRGPRSKGWRIVSSLCCVDRLVRVKDKHHA